MGTALEATTQPLTALLITTDCTCMHNAQCSRSHYNTLLDRRSLMWLVVTFAGDAPHPIHPLQCEDHNGRGEYSLTLHSEELAYKSGPVQENTPWQWDLCACVLCVWTTGYKASCYNSQGVEMWG